MTSWINLLISAKNNIFSILTIYQQLQLIQPYMLFDNLNKVGAYHLYLIEGMLYSLGFLSKSTSCFLVHFQVIY